MRSFLAVPLLVAGLVVPGAADAAADTCLGMPATIVGSPSDNVVGTEGPDVVVTNGAGKVDTLGGDDRVCVTTKGTFSVDTGPGDDQVEWVTRRHGGSVDLGAGSDTYTGGDQGSFVDAGDRADARAGQPLGVDTIRTGAGPDLVITGNTNVSLPNADTVDLGEGRDEAIVRGATPASLEGGGGIDDLFIRSTVRGDWVVDGATGVISLDGVAMPAASSFASYHLQGLRWDALEFHGGPGSELVTVSNKLGFVRNDGPFSADMGAGNDKLFVRSQDTGPFDGGPGNDSIWVEAKGTASDEARFQASLALDIWGLGTRPVVEIPSIENLSVDDADRAKIVGDDTANRLGAYGCGNTIWGRAGNDRMNGGATKGCYDCLLYTSTLPTIYSV